MSNKVYKKLLEARKKMLKPLRSGDNAFKKYKYITLEDIYNASLEFLFDEGLLMIHEKKYEGKDMFLITKIIDVESNEYIKSESLINTDLDAQGIGSQLTYFKKYDLGGLLALRTDFDDDGESISGKNVKKVEKINDAQINELNDLLSELTQEEQEKVFKFLKIGNIKELPKEKFESVKNQLNRKIHG